MRFADELRDQYVPRVEAEAQQRQQQENAQQEKIDKWLRLTEGALRSYCERVSKNSRSIDVIASEIG